MKITHVLMFFYMSCILLTGCQNKEENNVSHVPDTVDSLPKISIRQSSQLSDNKRGLCTLEVYEMMHSDEGRVLLGVSDVPAWASSEHLKYVRGRTEYEIWKLEEILALTYPAGISDPENPLFNSTEYRKAIPVPENDPYFKSVDGILFSRDGQILYRYPEEKEDLQYTIPDTVTHISEFAFFRCQHLRSVTIPSRTVFIGRYAFGGCPELKEIVVSPENIHFKSIDGVLFSHDVRSLIQCPGGKEGNYIMPIGVECVYSLAFGECRKLTSVTFSDHAFNVGLEPFFKCSGLVIYCKRNSVAYLNADIWKVPCIEIEEPKKDPKRFSDPILKNKIQQNKM